MENITLESRLTVYLPGMGMRVYAPGVDGVIDFAASDDGVSVTIRMKGADVTYSGFPFSQEFFRNSETV